MTPFSTTPETEVQDWVNLRAWLKGDVQGTELLEQFRQDPVAKRQEFEQWLVGKLKEAPAQISNIVAGGHVEKLINIASADKVILTLTANPQAVHQLPPDIADFTGRADEVEVCANALRSHLDRGNVTPIVGIAGMPGVGKSALAIRVCHRLAEFFPDAQLYLNLRGDSSGTMTNAKDALGTLIRTLGVSDAGMASDLDGRSSQFRGLTAGRRVLILLDNARLEAQIRPLIPASASCAVVVTSRAPLMALEGATQITLDVLNPTDGLELLTRIAGADRIAEDPASAKRLVSLAGGLPLALRILGGTLRGNRHRSVKSQVSILEDQQLRLTKLKLGDLEVRSSFDVSYLQLSASEKQLFRYVGALPGPTIGAETISWMSSESEGSTQEILDRLIEARLVEPVGELRFRLHDLMRLFAREKFQQEETPQGQKQLWTKLGNGIQYLVLISGSYLSLKGTPMLPAELQYKETREMSLGALSWFDLERANLSTLISQLHAAGNEELFLQLADPFLHYLLLRGRASEGVGLAEMASEVARALGKSLLEAGFRNTIGGFYTSQSNWVQAKKSFERALAIVRAELRREDELGILINLSQAQAGMQEMDDALRNSAIAIEGYQAEFPGNKADYGRALANRGNIFTGLTRWLEAIPYYQQALAIAEETKDIDLQSSTLLSLGNVLRILGRLDEALDAYSSSAQLLAVMEDRNAFAKVLFHLANVYNIQGRFSEGVAVCLQSLEIYREFSDQVGEAHALNNLGINYTDLGEWAAAEQSLLASIEIRKSLGDRNGIADVLTNLGNLESRRKRWKSAITRYTEAQNIYSELATTYEVAKMRLNIGNAELQLSKFHSAIVNFEAALEEFESKGDELLTAKAVLNLGLAYFHLEMRDRAFQNYEKASELFERIGDPQGYGATAHNIAKLFSQAGEWETAIDYYEKDLRICNELKDKPGALATLWELAICHLALEDLDGAEATLSNYLDLTRELFDSLGEGQALGNLASIANLRGDTVKAIKLGMEALEILSQLRHPDALIVESFVKDLKNA